MFRDLVSPRASAAAELEAITAERDFFKEKYAAHASEMEAMKTQLKESQRMVDKLRNQVLDLSQQVMELEGEKQSRSSGAEEKKEEEDRASLAEISNSEDNTDNAIDSQQPQVLSEVTTPTDTKKQTTKEDESSEKENNAENEDGESEGDSDNDEDDDDSHDDDEAEAIRLKASRMLAWASYQSSIRTPTKIDGEAGMETPTQPITSRPSAAHTLPSKVKSLLDEDEDTDDSSLVEQHQVASDSKLTVKGGKIGKFVSNLKESVMGTQSESDSSYVDESEGESSSDSECSNLSENLARMQLDVRFADGQGEH